MTRRYLEKPAKDCFGFFILFFPLLIWMYAVGYELYKRTPKNDRMHPIFYSIFLIYQVVYLFVFIYNLVTNTYDIFELMPFHKLAMVSAAISFFLTSLAIVRFERANGLKNSNLVTTFFKIWFYPLGIWSIQPLLNEYIKYEEK